MLPPLLVAIPGVDLIEDGLCKLGCGGRSVAALIAPPEGLQLLLDAGADPMAPSYHGQTAIQYARRHRNDALRQFVVRLMETHAGSADEPALSQAIRNRDMAAARERIEDGSEVNSVDGDGWAPLMWASSFYGSPQLVRQLLDAGADPNAVTRQGWTALMSAVTSGDGDTARALIAAGADVNAQEGLLGETVLMMAALYQTADTVQNLLAAGARATSVNAHGVTAIHRARRNWRGEREGVERAIRSTLGRAQE